MNRINLLSCFAVLAAICASVTAEPLKVVCATRTDKPPVIDGRLDDACWKTTEVRTDFTRPDGPVKREQVTSMRFVYDASAVYLGLEYHYDDIAEVKTAVARIIEKQGAPPKGVASFRNVTWRYNMETFFDPGATRIRYNQVMVNAANQYTGNYMSRWDAFKGGHTYRAAIAGDRLVFEFVYPHRGAKAGDIWGFNLVRNDGYPYAIWKRVGSSFHEPKRFGDLLLGSYAEWWEAAWERRVKGQMAALGARTALLTDKPELMALQAHVEREFRQVEELARAQAPVNRENFEKLYAAYGDFVRDLTRLARVLEVIDLIGRGD